MAAMKKATTKKSSDGSNTKPFNIRLMSMNALVGKEEPKKAPKKAVPAKPKSTSKATGPAAVKELQRQVSKSGVKKAEEGAKKGLDKKYPGLYKK
jgi:hypothetical protein